MEKRIFEQMFMKIINQFGARNYSQDKINLIYDEIKNITQDDFNKVLMHLIGNSRNSPNLQDFRKAIYDLGVKPKNVTSFNYEVIRAIQSDSLSDFVFPIKKNMWASKKYIFIRGEKTHKFMLRDNDLNEEIKNEANESEQRYKTIFVNLCNKDFKNGTFEFSKLYRELLQEF